MRVPTSPRRLLAVAGAAVLLTGALVAGAATPASADPPEVLLVESCGVATLTWDTGTIGGDETWATTVLRDGVAIDAFDMRPRGTRRYGAADGDVFLLRRAGLPDRSLVFNQPEGCDPTPRLAVTATVECHTLELLLSNEGTTPVTGLRLLTPASPTPQAVAPVEPGDVTLVLRLEDGARYALITGDPGADMVTWITGTYEQPAGCGPEAIQVTVTDACHGALVGLASRADGATRVTVLVDGVARVERVVAARATDSLTVAAEPGAVVTVRNSELALELARHTVSAGTCATPTPGDGTPSPGSGPSDGDGDSDGAAGGLPVTGAPGIALLAAGALLLAAGSAALVLARRRRIRFSAPR